MPSRRLSAIAIRPLIVAILAALLPALAVTPAQAGESQRWVLMNDVGLLADRFGSSELVTVTGVPAGGGIFPSNDVYVVANQDWSSVDQVVLRDISNPSGIPNTVIGAQVIQHPIYLPYMRVGEYDVVFDVDQDGVFDANFDEVIGFGPARGFQVFYDGNGRVIDKQRLKAELGAPIESTARLATSLLGTVLVAQILDGTAKALSLTTGLGAVVSGASPESMYFYQMGSDLTWETAQDQLLTGKGVEVGSAALAGAANDLWRSAAGIAADPPDPNYMTVALPVAPPFVLDESVADPVAAAYNVAANRMYEAASLQGALLHAMERLDGAAIDDEPDYVKLQADALTQYSNELTDKYLQLDAGIQALRSALSTAGVSIALTGEEVQRFADMQERVRTSGFTPEELSLFSAEGMSSKDVQAFRQLLLDLVPADMAADGDLALSDLGSKIVDARAATFDAAVQAANLAENVAPGGVNEAPTAVATAQPTAGQAPLTVTFSSSGSFDPDGTVASVHWDFGDGATASGPSAEHTYTSAGFYTATLTVTDNDGAAGSGYASVSVAPANQAPVAQFTTSAPGGRPGVELLFDGSSSYDPEGGALQHEWDFGDGASAEGAQASHAFAQPGVYNVTLTVSDPDSSSASRSVTVTISDTNLSPSADAGPDQTALEGSSAWFNASGSADPDGLVTTYEWHWGDGSPPTVYNGYPYAVHAFPDDDTFTVTLTVTDSDGATSSDTTIVEVANQPPNVYVGASGPVVPGQPRVYDASVTDPGANDVVTVEWDFGDGTVLKDQQPAAAPTHTYQAPGTYTITVTATDDDGGQGTASTTQTVVEPAIDAGPDWAWRANRQLSFDVSLDPQFETSDCTWDFGDGTNSSQCSFAHTYSDPGQYTATIRTTAPSGSPLTDSVTVTVLARDANNGGGASGGGAGVTVTGTNVLYTHDADWDNGTFVNLNHDAPDGDQLQINDRPQPFPFINVAASSRGTIVRIDVDSGEVIGEYYTAPADMGRNPSRTTVDQLGNVWVANRDEYSESGGRAKGSVARVGLVVGGTRIDSEGNPAADGDYIRGPYRYNTCVDRDGDGRLFTSRGLADIRPWSNTDSADKDGGVTTATDECIITYVRVNGTGTRTIAIDPNNDVWVGGLGNADHEKLDGTTGQPVPGSQFNLGCGGYGGLVDSKGVLWSATAPLRYDTRASTGQCLGLGAYGLGLDPNTGEIWTSSGGMVGKIAPDGTPIGSYTNGLSFSQGLAVDADGNVWVSGGLSAPAQVARLHTDGTLKSVVQLEGGQGSTGISIDANGKVWAANIGSDNAQRIDPLIGTITDQGDPSGWLDMTVDLGAGAGPYNYSDMTGYVSIGGTSPQGLWRVVQDAGTATAQWKAITWNTEDESLVPEGGSIEVEARAADTQGGLSSTTFSRMTNGSANDLRGRFIEVQVTLRGQTTAASPVLSDIRIEAVGSSANQPPTAAPLTLTAMAGSAVSVTLSATDPDGDALSYAVSKPPAHGAISGDAPALTYTPAAGFTGTDTFDYTVDDGRGGTATATVTITVEAVPNGDPLVDAGPDASGAEGSAIPLTGAVSDPDGDPVTVAWSWSAGAAVDPGATCTFTDPAAVQTSIACTDDGTYEVSLSADDGANEPIVDVATVTVANTAPAVSITDPNDGSTAKVGSPVTVTATVSDPGANDTHTCAVDFGDGTVTTLVVENEQCTSMHTYTSTLAAAITVTVTDDENATTSADLQLAVTDKESKVTGGGFITDGGRMSFGVVVNSTNQGIAGQTQLRAGPDRFHGTRVDALAVDGKTARYSGQGRWNGVEGYTFSVYLVDAGAPAGKKSSPSDSIRVVIRNPAGTVVLDRAGTLRGGNLTIHR